MNECGLSALLVGFVAFVCGGFLSYFFLNDRFQFELRTLADQSQQRYDQLLNRIFDESTGRNDVG